MATQALPDPSQFDDPNPGSHQPDSDEHSSAGGRQRASAYPSEEECLSYLAKIPSLVLMRVITPTQSNAIRASYLEILKHHRENRSREARSGLTDDTVLDLADKSPEILNMLEGFLTPEQIDLVFRKSSRKPR